MTKPSMSLEEMRDAAVKGLGCMQAKYVLQGFDAAVQALAKMGGEEFDRHSMLELSKRLVHKDGSEEFVYGMRIQHERLAPVLGALRAENEILRNILAVTRMANRSHEDMRVTHALARWDKRNG